MCKDYKERDSSIDHKGDEGMDKVIERYCPITESLEESLKQMKMIRKGQLPRKSWDSFKKELKEERENEENK